MTKNHILSEILNDFAPVYRVIQAEHTPCLSVIFLEINYEPFYAYSTNKFLELKWRKIREETGSNAAAKRLQKFIRINSILYKLFCHCFCLTCLNLPFRLLQSMYRYWPKTPIF